MELFVHWMPVSDEGVDSSIDSSRRILVASVLSVAGNHVIVEVSVHVK